MIREDHIRTLIDAYTTGTGKFLVDLTVSSTGNIQVMMDGDDGYTIADCAALSRYIEQHLDRNREDFSLEVSSCGVGNPLTLPRQYRKNTGRLLEVTLSDGKMIEGRIKESDDVSITLEIPSVKHGTVKTAGVILQRILITDISKGIIKIEF